MTVNDPRAFQGYTLLAPLTSWKTYLIDMRGRVVRQWESDCSPALGAYLLENGHLLRSGTIEKPGFGIGPGAGARVQEFTWDGQVVWDFDFAKVSSDKQTPHHDMTKLPNGNVLRIVWDLKSTMQAIAAGRRGETVCYGFLLADSLVEVKPTGEKTGRVVWEWHLWDHLVQDHDPSRANYGNVADHPELVDLNADDDVIGTIVASKGAAAKLRSIGYVGTTMNRKRGSPVHPDWSHCNGVAYNPALDQVVVSSLGLNEVWILDHSTTTREAAGHTGGRSGKGGDLLYRWGNPRAYGAGTKADQRLFGPHNAQWIAPGLPGAGHLLVFNNGVGRPDGTYSSVDEIVVPVDAGGRYVHKPGSAYGPEGPVWSYTAPKKSDFFSMVVSGAQRLANGNTLICSGADGIVFEVTPAKELVWKYGGPLKVTPVPRGTGPTSGYGQLGAGALFHANRYAPGYPGLAGKDLKPGKLIQELEAEAPREK